MGNNGKPYDRCGRCGEHLMFGQPGLVVGACAEHGLNLCRDCLPKHDHEVHGVPLAEAEREFREMEGEQAP